MRCPTLHDLPPPPPGKTGWPWTEETLPLPTSLPTGRPWPRVSVVTPSYNQGQYLEETIRSILLQGYPDLEYFIIDGNSADDSVGVIRRYERWLAGWVSEKDSGQADAINKGFARTTGEMLNWVNSDDLLLPGAVGRVARFFAGHPHESVVSGFRRVRQEGRHVDGWWVHPPLTRHALERNCVVAQETVFFRRQVYDAIGPLDATFRYALDYDYWQKMLAAGYTFALLPEALGVFRRHADSKGSRWMAVREQELRRIYRKYLNTDKTEGELFKETGAWRSHYLSLRALGRLGLMTPPALARLFIAHPLWAERASRWLTWTDWLNVAFHPPRRRIPARLARYAAAWLKLSRRPRGRVVFVALPETDTRWLFNAFANLPHFVRPPAAPLAARLEQTDDRWAVMLLEEPATAEALALLAARSVRYCLVWRDLRDLVVSRYFSACFDSQHPDYERFKDFDIERGLDYVITAELDTMAAWVRQWRSQHHPNLTLELRYESLLTDPVAVFAQVVGHCRLPFTSADTEWLVRRSPAETFPVGVWRELFTEAHRRAFKAKAGDVLVALGYETDANW